MAQQRSGNTSGVGGLLSKMGLLLQVKLSELHLLLLPPMLCQLLFGLLYLVISRHRRLLLI